jgi:hypothetical protein
MIVVSHSPLLSLAFPGRFCPSNWSPPFLNTQVCCVLLPAFLAHVHA